MHTYNYKTHERGGEYPLRPLRYATVKWVGQVHLSTLHGLHFKFVKINRIWCRRNVTAVRGN